MPCLGVVSNVIVARDVMYVIVVIVVVVVVARLGCSHCYGYRCC